MGEDLRLESLKSRDNLVAEGVKRPAVADNVVRPYFLDCPLAFVTHIDRPAWTTYHDDFPASLTNSRGLMRKTHI